MLKTTSFLVIPIASLFLIFPRYRSYNWTPWSPESLPILTDLDIVRGKYFRKILEWRSAAALSHQSYLQPQYCVDISGQWSGVEWIEKLSLILWIKWRWDRGWVVLLRRHGECVQSLDYTDCVVIFHVRLIEGPDDPVQDFVVIKVVQQWNDDSGLSFSSHQVLCSSDVLAYQ